MLMATPERPLIAPPPTARLALKVDPRIVIGSAPVTNSPPPPSAVSPPRDRHRSRSSRSAEHPGYFRRTFRAHHTDGDGNARAHSGSAGSPSGSPSRSGAPVPQGHPRRSPPGALFQKGTAAREVPPPAAVQGRALPELGAQHGRGLAARAAARSADVGLGERRHVHRPGERMLDALGRRHGMACCFRHVQPPWAVARPRDPRAPARGAAGRPR